MSNEARLWISGFTDSVAVIRAKNISLLNLTLAKEADGETDDSEGQLTVDVSDLIEDANETFFLNLAFNHEMLADQVHLWYCLSYKTLKQDGQYNLHAMCVDIS